MKGTELGVWVDEYDFSADTSQVDLTFEVGEGESSNLASTAQEFVPMLSKGTLQQNGYFDGVMPDGFEAELNARFGAGTALVTVLVQKSVPACVAYVLPGAAGYEMAFGAPMAGLVTLNGKWGTSVRTRRGLRIYSGTLAAVAPQTAVDFAAGVTTGGQAFLHVATITGVASGATIKVQSSPDNSVWSDEGTFTISAVGSFSLALSGVVGRYIRLNCTSLGGATGILCMAVVSLGE